MHYLERDEGQLPDADCGCAESGHQNRSDIIIAINDMNAEDIRKLIGQKEYLNRQFVSI